VRLATRPDGSRDGRLVLVSADQSRMTDARAAPTLQAALDRWDALEADLLAQANELERGTAEDVPFDAANCLAPLPRTYQWLDGSAYVNHVALARRARGAELPETFWTDPLMYQGGSDGFLRPTEPIRIADEAFGIDLEGEVAVITGDLPMGADRATAAAAVRLVVLVNDVSLRNLIPAEVAKGFGFVHGKPASALSPLAVSPDALGDAWDGARLHGILAVDVNGEPLGRADPGVDMTFDFPTLIAHAARTRRLGAGTIVGSGTVSNRDAAGGPGRPVAAGGHGYSCLVEQRAVETLTHGAPRTPFLRFGDRVRIEFLDARGRSPFGAIDQRVEPYP
jgi:fumarylacetoacetate (FAA) hydrolase